MNQIGRQAWRFIHGFVQFGGRRMAVAAILVGLGGLAEGVGILLLVPLLVLLTGTGQAGGWIGDLTTSMLGALGGQSRLMSLALLLGLFAVSMAARSAIILARDVILAQLQIGFVEAQRLAITRRLAATSWETINRLSHARLAHLMSADIQRCGVAATFTLQCGVAMVMLTAQLGLAFLLSPELASLSLALLVASALLLGPFLIRAHANGLNASKGQFNLTRDTGQFLGGLKQAFSHNREQAFVLQVEDTLEALRVNQLDFVWQRTGARMALTAMAAAIAGVALLVGHGVLGLAPAVLMTLLFVLARTSGPATQIQQGALQLIHALPAYDLVRALEAELALAARPSCLPTEGVPRPHFAPVIFERVSFSHLAADRSSKEAAHGVRDLDLWLEPGSFVGVSGPSGAGKTTFADLLSGLYPPASGQIVVGGQILEGATARTWRDRIAYVPQDPFLLHDTVRRNLLWSAPDASEAQLWEALAIAGADDLVRRLPQGLDTLVGERGARVSGGERQRLALASAILRRPELLILDEATSAVDTRTEDEILGRLRAAFPKALIVIIAHRAESLSRCDRILTLDRGRLDSASDSPGASAPARTAPLRAK